MKSGKWLMKDNVSRVTSALKQFLGNAQSSSVKLMKFQVPKSGKWPKIGCSSVDLLLVQKMANVFFTVDGFSSPVKATAKIKPVTEDSSVKSQKRVTHFLEHPKLPGEAFVHQVLILGKEFWSPKLSLELKKRRKMNHFQGPQTLPGGGLVHQFAIIMRMLSCPVLLRMQLLALRKIAKSYV